MGFYQLREKKNYFKYILITITLIISSCGIMKKEEQKEIILARVGDKTISLNEFIRRAEYTIRPPYCKGDNNIHKKIILNSLIAEKMLALEAGENNTLDQNKRFQLYIQGRQEQAMREQLLKEEVYRKVEVDESEIQAEFDVAGRNYKIQYFNILDNNIASRLNEELINRKGYFEELHQQLWPGENLPEREVTWQSQENSRIHDTLFSKQLNKGTVIKPVRISDNHYIIIKVLGWTDKLAISETERTERLNAVREKLTMEQAQQDYDRFVVGIMAGKKLEFNPQIFEQLAHLVKPLYTLSPNEKNELFLNTAFNRSGENSELNQLAEGVSDILEEPFFSIDGRSWTVTEFMEELQRHPLVFRNKIDDKTNFTTQYKLAIVDLVRDHYLTEEAYKRGIQNADVVKRYTQMWRDNLLALQQKNQYLRERIPDLSDSLNMVTVIEEYLNPYIDELQEKYSDRVEVNVQQFNDIHLTRIDMYVTQQNVPFPVMVPAFPSVTTDYKLDYGKRIE